MRLDAYIRSLYPLMSMAEVHRIIKEEKRVSINGLICSKPGKKVDDSDIITIDTNSLQWYVSRAGHKLQAAISHFSIPVAGKSIVDVGLSTGGFTHCLLQNNVASVIGIDVGTAQVHPLIQSDPRVLVREQTDVRNVHDLHNSADGVVVDVSFISLLQVLPSCISFLKKSGWLCVLIKPQFELNAQYRSSSGIVRDIVMQEAACKKIKDFLITRSFRCFDIIPSPIVGGDGNQEFLLYAIMV